MSGRNQHYIPRFLMKGFASRTNKKQVYTWVYRNHTPAFEANIMGIGSERDFYTIDNNSELDDAITDDEGAYSVLIERLRDGQVNEINVKEIADLIFHLQFRSKWLRAKIAEHSSFMMESLIDQFKSPIVIERIVESLYTTQSEKLEKALSENSTLYRSKGLSKNAARKHVKQYIRENKTLMMEHLRGFMRTVEPLYLQVAAKSAKDAHINSLKRVDHTNTHIKYESYKYQVLEFPTSSLILGDSIIILPTDEERKFIPIWNSSTNVSAVILPISTTQLLIGSNETYAITPDDYNAAAAALSSDFFISSQHSDNELSLQNSISQNAYVITNNELNQIIASKDIQALINKQ